MPVGGLRVSRELPRQAVRPTARPAWIEVEGVEVLPPCRWCGTPLVWRGTWCCEGCFTRHGLDPDYVLTDIPHGLPVEAIAGVPLDFRSGRTAEPAPVFSAGEGDNSTAAKIGASRRGVWWESLEALTSFGRRAHAARFVSRGAKSAVDGPVSSHWHFARAASLAQRWERIAQCGSLALMAAGPGGRVVPIENRCGDWRACHRCRDRRRWQLQRDGEIVAASARRVYARQIAKHYRGPEGRWSERMVTLTVPHSGSVATDAELYRAAWPKWLRRLLRHLRERGVNAVRGRGRVGLIPWRRACEVATTREAHFHGHVWLLCPFVDQVLLHVWWGQALIESGLPLERMPRRAWADVGPRDARVHGWLGFPDEVPWPVVDVRGGDRSGYVAKVGLVDYVVKSDGVKESLHPAHAANAYEALTGLRVVQWASGWAPGRDGAGWHVRRATDAERAEWCARLARNSGVASERKDVESVAPEAAPAEPVEASCRVRDGPETATALTPLGTGVRAVQLSLGWGGYKAT